MHYNTKTVDEYVNKIKRGGNNNAVYDVNERIERFFSHNNFTEEKLKIFEKAFKPFINIVLLMLKISLRKNKKFIKFHKYNSYSKVDIYIKSSLRIFLCLFLLL